MRAAMLRYRKPELLQAVKIPLSPQEMDNATLVVLSELGQHSARTEMLKRHIMGRDQVNYDKAHEQYKIISAKNKENMYLLSLPYHIGILVSLSCGLFSVPLVFHLPTALWFNQFFVTTDIPDTQDLETLLEVGAWTWNWMYVVLPLGNCCAMHCLGNLQAHLHLCANYREPPLGTISFLLLTLQFSRSQLQNLGAKPYTARVKQWRGERLAQAFPQYDAKIIMDYSETSSIQATRKEIN
jgi:hypothetical protein